MFLAASSLSLDARAQDTLTRDALAVMAIRLVFFQKQHNRSFEHE
jgi:hypothetical protein